MRRVDHDEWDAAGRRHPLSRCPSRGRTYKKRHSSRNEQIMVGLEPRASRPTQCGSSLGTQGADSGEGRRSQAMLVVDVYMYMYMYPE